MAATVKKGPSASKSSTAPSRKNFSLKPNPAAIRQSNAAAKQAAAAATVDGSTARSGKKSKAGAAAAHATPNSKHASSGRGKKTRTVAEAASNITADSKGYVFINGRRVRMISTHGQLPPRKTRDNNVHHSGKDDAEQIAIKNIKTKLSRKELTQYRELLLKKRHELIGDLSAMENEALRSGGGNLSHMPIHMADIGTDTFDQDFMLGLAAAERDQLREIDEALSRIQDRTYGVCQLTGKPIPKARLDAKPWAKHTIEAARQLEGQWSR